MVGVAVNVAEDPAHIGFVPVVSAIATEGASKVFTVIVIPALFAVVGLAQVAFDVRIHVTISPFAKPAVVNVGAFSPALIPSTCHWYAGEAPPLVGVAVNVAEAPAHIGLLPVVCAIITEGTSNGFTVIVMPALVAVVGLAHVALDVNMHVII